MMREQDPQGPFRVDSDETPFNMPKDIFWDINEGAQVARAQWVIDNRPDIPLDYLSYRFCLQEKDLAQLKTPEHPQD